MTKQELIKNLENPKLNFFVMLSHSVEFVKTEPYKSRLINYMFGRAQLQIKFTNTDLLRWFIDFVKPDFLETNFFKLNGNHIQVLKSIWFQSYLVNDVVATIRAGKPLPVVTAINEQLEEVKADITLSEEERKKLIGQLRAQRMREAKAVKREARLAEEAAQKLKEQKEKEQYKKEVVPKNTDEEPKEAHKNPTVTIKGRTREMTDEELAIIESLKKLNT